MFEYLFNFIVSFNPIIVTFQTFFTFPSHLD